MLWQIMSIKRILPSDTRAIELVSCAALAATALQEAIGLNTSILNAAQTGLYWAMVLTLVPLAHVLTLMFIRYDLIIRSLLCWVAGIFWVYRATFDVPGILSRDPDPASFFIGMGCFYAMVINVGFLRSEWNKSY
jgi:hypothetical protein